jgi:hypothetical protein
MRDFRLCLICEGQISLTIHAIQLKLSYPLMAHDTAAEYLYWAAFAIPLILVFVGGFVDKLVSTEPIQWKHFYLGLDLTLSALTTSLVNLIDVIKGPDVRPLS